MKLVLVLLLFGLLQLELAQADGQDVFDQNAIQDVSQVKISPVIERSQVLKRKIRSSLNRNKNGKTKGNGRRKIKGNKLKRKDLTNKRTRKVSKTKGNKLKRAGKQNRRVGKVSKTSGSKLKRKSVKRKTKTNRNKNNTKRKRKPKKAKKGIQKIDKRKKMVEKIRQQVRQNNCDLDMCKRSSNFYSQIVRLNDRSKIINSRAKKSDAYELVAKIITNKCEANTNTTHLNTSLLNCAASITSTCVAPKIPDDLTYAGKCLPEIEKFTTACGDSTTPCPFQLANWTDFITSHKSCRPSDDEKNMSSILRTCSKGVKPCKLVETATLNYVANCQLPNVTCPPSPGNCSVPCACTSNSDCPNFRAPCQLHSTSCEYCSNCTCKPGCSSQANCPIGFTCNGNHECVPEECPVTSTPSPTSNTANTANTTTSVNTTTTVTATTTTVATTTTPCTTCGDHPCNCIGDCSGPSDNCTYCDSSDGKCKPGCEDSSDCPGVQACSKNTHKCFNPGTTVVDTLEMATCNCTGCNATSTGAEIFMKGDTGLECTIANLGNASKGDYDTSFTKTFRSTSNKELGECNWADLDGYDIEEFKVTWNGEGAWTPCYFYITFTGTSKTENCTYTGEPLQPGNSSNSTTLTCVRGTPSQRGPAVENDRCSF